MPAYHTARHASQDTEWLSVAPAKRWPAWKPREELKIHSLARSPQGRLLRAKKALQNLQLGRLSPEAAAGVKRDYAVEFKQLGAVLAAAVLLLTVGCTQNQRARSWGGTAEQKLPPGQKLVTATWKMDHLWLLTRPMKTNETAETYTFQESSSFGLVEGKVIIREVSSW